MITTTRDRDATPPRIDPRQRIDFPAEHDELD
jgi:hypothetical protein